MGMNLQTRVGRLEDAAAERDASAWDLTLLTDAQLLGLEACFRKAEVTGESVHAHITPELEAALERVKR